jgi:hypothetical protein
MLERAAIAAARRNGALLQIIGRDLSSVYADGYGTSSTALSGLAGLILDRSYGLPGAVGPEICTDPGIDIPGWWVATASGSNVASVSGGVVTVLSADGAYTAMNAPVFPAVSAGRKYVVEYTIDSVSGGGLRVDVGGNIGSAHTSPGTYSRTFTATGNYAPAFVRGAPTANAGGVASRLSLREIVDGALGSELAPATSSTTGWTVNSHGSLTSDGDSLTLTNTSGAAEGSYGITGLAAAAGKTYLVTMNVLQADNGGALTVGGTRVGLGGAGLKTLRITAANSSGFVFGVNVGTAGPVLKARNISVRELLGGHGHQVNASYRPSIVMLPSGYMALNFGGTDDWMNGPMPAAQPTAETLIWAGRFSGAAGTQYALARRSAAGAFFLRRNGAGGLEMGGLNNGLALWTSAGSAASTDPVVMEAVGVSGNSRMWIGGALAATQGATLTLAPPSVGLGIGCQAAGDASGPMRGDMALACWAPTEIPADDRAAIARFAALLSGAPYAG